MSLHHYQTGFPPWFKPPTGLLKVAWDSHAIAAAVFDRYGRAPMPDVLNLSAMQCIEIEANDRWPRGSTQRVVKLVVRGNAGPMHDVTFVIRYIDNRPTVITCWMNEKSDQHKTLKRDRYRAASLPKFAPLKP